MKIKAERTHQQKLEKKSSGLLILDLYMQRGQAFSISVIANKFEYRKIYDYNDNLIIPWYYPRIKNISFYNNDLLQRIHVETLFIQSLFKQHNLENSYSEDKNNLDNISVVSYSNVKESSNLTLKKSKECQNFNEVTEKKGGNTDELSLSKSIHKSALKEICNINNELKELVYKEEKLNLNQIKIIEIVKDGNCFYRCLSYFLLKSEEYYQNIKNLIVEWIENNYDNYLEFFGDDDSNNMTKEEIAKNEFDYIKSKDSWGSHYIIATACLILKIDIAVYTYEGNNIYKPYNLFKIDDEEKELCILNYHNNYHFDLIYSIHELVSENTLYNSFSKIKQKKKLKKIILKLQVHNLIRIM